MACRGCSSSNTNQRRNGSYGCRSILPEVQWSCGARGGDTRSACNSCMNYCSSNSCTSGCNCCANNGCGNVSGTNNGCTNCGCSHCQNNGCTNCGCNNNGCIQPRGTSASCNGSPYYNGPCGSVEPVRGCCGNCPNQSCCAHHCNCCHHHCGGAASAVYGYFTQEGSLELAASGAVPFNGTSSSVGIMKSGSELMLTEGGAYMISLSVNIPANVTLNTEFDTLIDGGIAAGGTVMIHKTQTAAPLHAHTQTVVSAAAGSVIRIVSSEAVNLNYGDQIVVLNIAKVG